MTGATTPYDGMDLLNEVFDLIRRELPGLMVDDPCRAPLAAMMPSLAALLGRPRLEVAR